MCHCLGEVVNVYCVLVLAGDCGQHRSFIDVFMSLYNTTISGSGDGTELINLLYFEAKISLISFSS